MKDAQTPKSKIMIHPF